MRILFVYLALFVFWTSPVSAGKKVVLASLEWPPYTGEELHMQGATASIVRAAFKAAGYELEIRFLPWNRARETARFDETVDGYFPEYPDIERNKAFLCSESVGKSPVGFAKRKARNIRWLNYSDLEKYLVGVVDGYVNSAKFDKMVDSGDIRTDESVSDVLNLRKVLADHVDLGVVDINVYNYLLHNDLMLHSRRGELRLGARLLTINDLFVCFKPTARGKQLLKSFNQGLSTIHPLAMQQEYVDRLDQMKK